jgi:hypothetical protein
MSKGSMYSMIVTKDMVDEGRVLDIQKAISKLESAGVDTFQRVAIAFHGYDDTSVELWEMPEVRKWVGKLINKVPHLFYHVEQEVYQTQQTLMICLNDYDSVYAGERKSPEEHYHEGTKIDELPQHKIKVHVHQKSFRLMSSEIRKHARQIGKMANAEKVIKEMSERYGVSAN